MPLEKKIGQARPEVVPSLIVMNADGATLDAGTLTVQNVAGNSYVFADRPVRAAVHALTSVLLDERNPSYPTASPPTHLTPRFRSSVRATTMSTAWWWC